MEFQICLGIILTVQCSRKMLEGFCSLKRKVVSETLSTSIPDQLTLNGLLKSGF